MTPNFPVGKLPPGMLAKLLNKAPKYDPRLLLGPGIGLDCAVIDDGDKYLVFKTDPITFATDQIGWYAVQVNANDIATSGAEPRWMLVTLLLPEQNTDQYLVENIFDQLYRACAEINVTVIGGHTEVTFGLERSIVIASMVGEASHSHLVTPQGARPEDRVLITKGVPIEATALIAREFPERLTGILDPEEIVQASNFLNKPGISIVRDARVAMSVAKISAMHDPTEGGVKAALWELAEASKVSIMIDSRAVPIPPISARICKALQLDPMAAIASGALLLTLPAAQELDVIKAFESAGIVCASIGEVCPPPVGVWDKSFGQPALIPCPERDEIARLYQR